jgi:capsid protein
MSRSQSRRAKRQRMLAAQAAGGSDLSRFGSGDRGHIPAPRAGYDAVQTGSKKRRQSVAWAKDEDSELSSIDRRRLRNTVLDQGRNFSVVSWAINQVLNYNTRFAFQSMTGDATLDAEIERLIDRQSTASRFDVTGRMDRGTFVRTLYACMLADGDAMGMKMANGALQGVEGDRIAWPSYGAPQDASGKPYSTDEFTHGVRRTAAGKIDAYMVCKRETGGMLSYERLVPADRMLPFVMYRRFDQVRGVSPLASALATAQDLYEANEAYAIKSKMVAWAGMIIKREAKDVPIFQTSVKKTAASGDETSAGKTQYDIDMDGRPFVLDMEGSDGIEFVESATPPAEFMAHAEMMIRLILIALDIPYTFYDQTRGSYTIQKDAWMQWEIASEPKRAMVRNWLSRWTYWQLFRLIAAGELVLPRALTVNDLVWEWQHAGRPWMDVKELAIDIESVKMGMAAITDVIKRQGNEPDDIIEKNRIYYDKMRRAGLPTASWDDKTNPNMEKDDEAPASSPAGKRMEGARV